MSDLGPLPQSGPTEQPGDPPPADDAQTYYDQETEVRFLADVLRRLQNKHAIDVGAERGSVVGALLAAGADAVYAFEPFPANVAALREAYGENPTVHIYDLALGARDERRNLHVVEDKTHQIADAYHTLVAFDETPTLRIVDEITIQCRTLDGLVAEETLPARVGVLKIDTERSDLAVLQGMGRLHADVVMLEFWDSLPETVGSTPYQVSGVAALMAGRGYRNYLLFKRFDQFESVQLNVSETRPGDWGNLLFVHDSVFPLLAELIYGCVSQAQTRLVDRAVMFANEAQKRLVLVEQGALAAEDARAANEQMTADLVEKEYVIAELTAVADERLLVIQHAASAAQDARIERERLADALAQMAQQADERPHAAETVTTGTAESRAADRQYASLLQKETVIAELRAIADERLELVARLDAEATRLRGACDELADELEERARIIENLSKTAEERVQLLEQAAAENAEAHRQLAKLVDALEERQRVVVELAATAEERQRLIDQFASIADERQQLIDQLAAVADERQQIIDQLIVVADERLRMIENANAAAESNRSIVEALESDVLDLRNEAKRLYDELDQRERLLVELTRTADERLAIVNRSNAEASETRAAVDELTASLQEKEATIAELSATAAERLRLLDMTTSDASNAHAEAERLRHLLGEQAAVIADLKSTADERLLLIDRLTAEAAQTRRA